MQKSSDLKKQQDIKQTDKTKKRPEISVPVTRQLRPQSAGHQALQAQKENKQTDKKEDIVDKVLARVNLSPEERSTLKEKLTILRALIKATGRKEDLESITTAVDLVRDFKFSAEQVARAEKMFFAQNPNPFFELMRFKHITPKTFDQMKVSDFENPNLILWNPVVILVKMGYIDFPTDLAKHQERIAAVFGYKPEVIEKAFPTKKDFLTAKVASIPEVFAQILPKDKPSKAVKDKEEKALSPEEKKFSQFKHLKDIVEPKEILAMSEDHCKRLDQAFELIKHDMISIKEALKIEANKGLKFGAPLIIDGLISLDLWLKLPPLQQSNLFKLSDFVRAKVFSLESAITASRTEIAALLAAIPDPKEFLSKNMVKTPVPTKGPTSSTDHLQKKKLAHATSGDSSNKQSGTQANEDTESSVPVNTRTPHAQ